MTLVTNTVTSNLSTITTVIHSQGTNLLYIKYINLNRVYKLYIVFTTVCARCLY